MEKLKAIFNQVKTLALKPAETWPTIAQEETTVMELLKGYLVYLAAVPALGQFIGYWLVGFNTHTRYGFFRFTFIESLVNAAVTFILTVISIWAFAKLLAFFSPRFGGGDDEIPAFKLAIFGIAPCLIAGALFVIPQLDGLVFLVGVYCLYLLYVGVPILMGTPKEKTLPYAVVVVVSLVLIAIVISAITGPLHNAFGPNLRGI